jgi:hypothetical protein
MNCKYLPVPQGLQLALLHHLFYAALDLLQLLLQ